MFKGSYYNLYFKDENDANLYIVFNTLSNSIAEIDENTFKYLNGENITLDEEITKTLMDNSFIIEEKCDELKVIQYERIRAKFERDTLNLVIATTMDCNMKCSYCFEMNNPEVGDSYMTTDVEEKLVDFVEGALCSKKYSGIAVSWFGGEPLLDINRLYGISDKLIYLADKYNLSYNANITTNGSLLNPEIAYQLSSRCKISFAQITIDGIEGVHNTRRILKNGNNSFDSIIKNIDDCFNLLNIIIRVNVDAVNKDTINELSDFLLNEKKWGGKVKVYLAQVKDCEKSNVKQIQFNIEFNKINYEFTKRLMDFNLIHNKENFFPESKPIFCAAETNSCYLIDPKGDVYKCERELGDSNKRIGSVMDDYDLINLNRYEWLLNEINDKCKKCKYLPLCQGGCAYENYNLSVICEKTYYDKFLAEYFKSHFMEAHDGEQ